MVLSMFIMNKHLTFNFKRHQSYKVVFDASVCFKVILYIPIFHKIKKNFKWILTSATNAIAVGTGAIICATYIKKMF
jgi:putative flippase GtrA